MSLTSLYDFFKNVGESMTGPDRLLEDGLNALPNGISVPMDPKDPFWVTIRNCVEAYDKRFEAILEDIGVYIPRKILGYIDPDAASIEQLDDRLTALKGRLNQATTDLNGILTKSNMSFFTHTVTARNDLRTAVQSLTPIAEAIAWKFDKKMADPVQRDTLSKDIEEKVNRNAEDFKTASTSANKTLEESMHTEAQAEILNVRDATILGHPDGIKDAAEYLKADIKTWIDGTKKEIEGQKKTLEDLHGALTTQQETLSVARKRYEEAVADRELAEKGEIAAWILCWPVGLALHLTIRKDLVEDVANTQRLVDDTERHVKQTEADVQGIERRLLKLQELQSRGNVLDSSLGSFEHDIAKTIDAAAIHREATKAAYQKVLNSWDYTKKVQNAAKGTGWALTKAQYAEAIMTALANALFEKSIVVREPARFVLWRLRDADDQGKVAAIRSATLYGGEPLLEKLLEDYETDPDTGVRCTVM